MKLISSILLSTLLILSTTGLRISQHWCGESLVNISIWGKAEPCEHFGNAKPCAPDCPMKGKMQKNCCDEREADIPSIENDFQGSIAKIGSPQYSLVALIAQTNKILDLELTGVVGEHNHSPPELCSDLFLVHESLLI